MPSGRTRAWDGSHRRPSQLACRHRVRNGTERSRSLGASRPVPLRLTSKQDLFNQGLWLPMDERRGARQIYSLHPPSRERAEISRSVSQLSCSCAIVCGCWLAGCKTQAYEARFLTSKGPLTCKAPQMISHFHRQERSRGRIGFSECSNPRGRLTPLQRARILIDYRRNVARKRHRHSGSYPSGI